MKGFEKSLEDKTPSQLSAMAFKTLRDIVLNQGYMDVLNHICIDHGDDTEEVFPCSRRDDAKSYISGLDREFDAITKKLGEL